MPVPRGGGIVKDEWWKLWADADYPPYGTCVGSLDTAYKEHQEADFSAMTVWGAFEHPETKRPALMLRAAWQERIDLAQLVRRVLRTCREHKVDVLLIEDTARGIDVQNEIYRLIGRREIRVILVKPNGDKVARLNATVPIFESGIVFAPEKDWSEMVIRQVASFPRGKHDDLVDTVSQALIYLRNTGVALRSEEHDEMVRARRLYRKPQTAVYDV
jgi:predicted phage terminase large subunit-like protein